VQAQTAIVILAGGRSTRLAGKLFNDFAGEPLIVRVFRNLSCGRPVCISVNGRLPPRIAALLPCPKVRDRYPDSGPLGGLLSAAAAMRCDLIFAAAGDAPYLTSAFVDRLCARWRAQDEALVPEHAGCLQPLASLYQREALIREGTQLLAGGAASLHQLIARLRHRRLACAERLPFDNVNTPRDYAAALRRMQ
jgi:molybdopterin-guanine dinucleotide biosynthesis protein A